MPFALLIIGIFLLATAVQGTQDDLFKLIKGDLTGKNNFIYWMVAILIVGSIGYIPKLKPVSVIFLTLLAVVVFTAKKGIGTTIFQQFNTQIAATSSASGSGATPSSTSAIPTLPNLSTGAIGDLSSIIGGLVH